MACIGRTFAGKDLNARILVTKIYQASFFVLGCSGGKWLELLRTTAFGLPSVVLLSLQIHGFSWFFPPAIHGGLLRQGARSTIWLPTSSIIICDHSPNAGPCALPIFGAWKCQASDAMLQGSHGMTWTTPQDTSFVLKDPEKYLTRSSIFINFMSTLCMSLWQASSTSIWTAGQGTIQVESAWAGKGWGDL